MAPSIVVEDVRFSYGAHEALCGLSLSIERGRTVTLLGPNGAGKSTLIELIVGTLRPLSGRVEVLGENPAQATAAWLARIGVAAQSTGDRPKWRLIDLLRWVRAHYEIAGRECMGVDEVIAMVGLSDKRHARLAGMSGGERRRADLAAAIIGWPDLLILDEPTTGLDPASKRMIHDLLADLADRGTSILLSTHDLTEAQKVADQVVVMSAGRVVFDGTAQSLRDRVGGHAEVTWLEGGTRHVHSTDDAEAFIRTLDLGAVTNLEVTRADLEEAYLDLLAHGEVQGA